MIVVIDNYDSFTYNLVHYLGELGGVPEVWRNDTVDPADVVARAPDAIVLSPGPCTPNEAGICLDLIAAAADTIPIFGVCLGHQAIGQAFGGTILRAPELMHGKTSPVRHAQTGVFDGVPQDFIATRYHSLTIDRESFPDCLEMTAESHDGVIMGLSHKTLPLHGVQFHPESIASEHGHTILKNFLALAERWNAARSPAA